MQHSIVTSGVIEDLGAADYDQRNHCVNILGDWSNAWPLTVVSKPADWPIITVRIRSAQNAGIIETRQIDIEHGYDELLDIYNQFVAADT